MARCPKGVATRVHRSPHLALGVRLAHLGPGGAKGRERRTQSWQWSEDGGTSSAGLRSKKPIGFSQKETTSTGITGQSSGRGMWLIPNTY